MPIIEKTVPAPELIGTPGYPIHYEAYGLPAPTKIIQVMIDDDGNEIPDITPTPPGSPRIVYKADIWRRATEREAVTMDAMLNSQTVRLRRMWADAVYLSEGDELFPVIRAALVSEFGGDRADELLA